MNFTCKRGNRVSSMKFKNGTIVRVDQEPIPMGHDERWWEKSMDYTPPEKPYAVAYKAGRADAGNEAKDDIGFDERDKFGHSGYEDDEDKYTTLPGQNMNEVQRQCRNHEDVSFLRPDGSVESKGIDWCLGNDFFQVEEGLWSGPWFYKKYPKAECIHGERVKRTQQIRSLCENQSECDSYNKTYEYIPSENGFEYCDMEGGICTCSQHRYPLVSQEACKIGEEARQRRIEAFPKKKKRKRSKSKSKKPKHLDPEKREKKNQRLLERVKKWSKGDEALMSRAEDAAERNCWSYHCPVPRCKTRFPSEEVLALHVQNAMSKSHLMYRKKRDDNLVLEQEIDHRIAKDAEQTVSLGFDEGKIVPFQNSLIGDSLQSKDAEINKLKNDVASAKRATKMHQDALVVASSNSKKAMEKSASLETENYVLKAQISKLQSQNFRMAAESLAKDTLLQKQLSDHGAEVVQLHSDKRKLEMYTKLTLDKFESKYLVALRDCKAKLKEKHDRVEALEIRWEMKK